MTPKTIRDLRERLSLTQEAFAHILGVSFATVNRWENEKTEPTGDYARVLQTLQQLTAQDGRGPAIDWKRVGALSAMAAVAGFSPLLTLGAALAPVLIAHLPSWSDVPLGSAPSRRLRPQLQGKNSAGARHIPRQPVASDGARVRGKAKVQRARPEGPSHANSRRRGL